MGKDCWNLGPTQKVYVETGVHGNTPMEKWVGTFWSVWEGGLIEVVWGQCEAFKSVTKSGFRKLPTQLEKLG